MAWFLKRYLIITGALALLTLTFPGLVVFGLFLFIVPGLILALAPTAFIWGAIYAPNWLLMKPFLGPRFAAVAASLVTAAILWAIPQPSIKLAHEELKRYHLAIVTPKNPVKLSGDIRIDTQFPKWDNNNQKKLGFRPFACDSRCLALLFEPNVSSVTITKSPNLAFDELKNGFSSLDSNARTYRLVPIEKCGEKGLSPYLDSRFGQSMEDNRAISLEWGRKLTSKFCIIGEEPLDHFDVLLRTGLWRSSYERKSNANVWSFQPKQTSGYFGEIRTSDGTVLFRQFNLTVKALTVPISVDFPFKGPVQWSSQRFPKRASNSWETPVKAVDAVLDVRRTADMQGALNGIRSALAESLENSSLQADAAAFKSIDDYLKMLKNEGSTAEDFELIRDLILDHRFNDLDSAWMLPDIFTTDQLEILFPIIVKKLSSLPDTVRPDLSNLGRSLVSWPDGFFADPDRAAMELLNNPVQRRRVTGLISRSSDIGPRAAPLLADIVAYHLSASKSFNKRKSRLTLSERNWGYSAHRKTMYAAIIGMCRLGPDGSSQLSRMLQIEKGVRRDGSSRLEWDRMMAIIGKPINEIEKPKDRSGTAGAYRDQINGWIARYDPKKSCI